MATLAEHIAARNDEDLIARFTAAAEIERIADPASWARAHMGELVTCPVDDEQTISDVYAYAVATYKPAPAPGANPSAVTDTQIRAAVKRLESSNLSVE